MQTIPNHLRPFFWDTDLAQINTTGNKQYIIERILELGDVNAVWWLFSTYSVGEIKEVLNQSRRITAKSQNFWRIIFEKP